jgi:hypothetical protein
MGHVRERNPNILSVKMQEIHRGGQVRTYCGCMTTEVFSGFQIA